MDYKILDREFRDYTKELKYPFSDEAIMGSVAGLPLSSDTFLDIIVYSSEDVKLPFYLSSVRQSEDTFVMEIRDANDVHVAEGSILCTEEEWCDNVTLYKNKTEAGNIVYDRTIIKQLMKTAAQGPILFGNNLPIQVSRCYIYKSNSMTGIRIPDGSILKDTVVILASEGVTFELEEDENGDKSKDKVYLNLYGEDPDDRLVREINGIKREQIWFAAHPNSGVKIETISNGVKFRSIIDE